MVEQTDVKQRLAALRKRRIAQPCRYCNVKQAVMGQWGCCGPGCRFLSKIGPEDEQGCWPWQGAHHNRRGYGRITVRGVRRTAHAYSYEFFRGRIPYPLMPDHLCRNTNCVNPHHLELVTNQENVRRGLNPEQNRARARLITECPKGHPYDEENTYRSPAGWRACRACHREKERTRPRHHPGQRPGAGLRGRGTGGVIMRYWLIADSTIDEIRRGLTARTHAINDYNCEDWPPGDGCSGCRGDEARRSALHALDSGLHTTNEIPLDMQEATGLEVPPACAS